MNIWQPKENETLQYYHESDNDYDLFATKTCRDAAFHQKIIVDHLPLEIYFFYKTFAGSATLTVAITSTLSNTHFQRSPLVQRNLEIPCFVNASLIGTKNKEILAKYLEMVETHYTELSSNEDVIMGFFLAMSVSEDANTVNRKTAPKVPIKKQIIEQCTNAQPQT